MSSHKHRTVTTFFVYSTEEKRSGGDPRVCGHPWSLQTHPIERTFRQEGVKLSSWRSIQWKSPSDPWSAVAIPVRRVGVPTDGPLFHVGAVRQRRSSPHQKHATHFPKVCDEVVVCRIASMQHTYNFHHAKCRGFTQRGTFFHSLPRIQVTAGIIYIGCVHLRRACF